MRRGFIALGDVVRAGLRHLGLEGRVREKTAVAIWPEVVGERTAAATRADRAADGILYVTCRDSVWAQQLHFLRPVIIEKLNERLGASVVSEIRLSGVGFRKAARGEEEKRGPAKLEKGADLPEQEMNRIREAVSSIENPELAERVLRGLRASRVLRKRRE